MLRLSWNDKESEFLSRILCSILYGEGYLCKFSAKLEFLSLDNKFVSDNFSYGSLRKKEMVFNIN